MGRAPQSSKTFLSSPTLNSTYSKVQELDLNFPMIMFRSGTSDAILTDNAKLSIGRENPTIIGL